MKPLILDDYGIKLYKGILNNHDYLWFSSSEIAQQSSTWPVIHNYALSYALSHYSYGIYLGSVPKYFEDLEKMPLYATPAINSGASRMKITMNVINDRTLKTELEAKKNTPSLGKKVVIQPEFSSNNSSGFLFYCYTWDDYNLPGTFRIGKKGCAVRVNWQEIKSPKVYFLKEPVSPSHPLNPIDLNGQLLSYEPIMIPPHMIFRKSKIQHDYFVFAGNEKILFPKRLLERVNYELNN